MRITHLKSHIPILKSSMLKTETLKIALFITAIGNDVEYLPKLVASARKHFMVNDELTFVIFTNQESSHSALQFLGIKTGLLINKIDSNELPEQINYTLLYKQFMEKQSHKFDYCYAIAPNAYFYANVNQSVLHDLVAVRHCAFVNDEKAHLRNKKSSFCIKKSFTGPYLTSDFYGGSAFWFYYMNKLMNNYMDAEKAKGITHSHGIEKALNKFFSEVKDSCVILSPQYHYPEWIHDNKLLPNPVISVLWDRQKQYFESQMQLKLPLDAKIVFAEKRIQ
jgi:hypothetical protein